MNTKSGDVHSSFADGPVVIHSQGQWGNVGARHVTQQMTIDESRRCRYSRQQCCDNDHEAEAVIYSPCRFYGMAGLSTVISLNLECIHENRPAFIAWNDDIGDKFLVHFGEVYMIGHRRNWIGHTDFDQHFCPKKFFSFLLLWLLSSL